MGIVYKANDPALNRPVAIKTLLPASHFPPDVYEELKQRFDREAHAAGGLNHPGVVTVYDVGVAADTGEPYFAMEYIEGQTLERLLREHGALSPRQVAEFGGHLALALAHAHEHGVIHRDLKPSNILIDQLARARLTDFGIARIRDSRLTRQDRFLGTICFAAPEQLRGHTADPVAEIFSLGLILYHMLTGTRAFSGSDTYALMQAILHEQPEPPAGRISGLDEAWNSLVMGMLEKERSRRPPSMQAVAAALARLRTGHAPAATLVQNVAAVKTLNGKDHIYTLTVLKGPDAGRRYPLSAQHTVIGREQAGIVLNDPTVSRKHVEIAVQQDGQVLVRDLDSRNGTFVNGTKITSVSLSAGDILMLGDWRACLNTADATLIPDV
jgi:serine/threonine-protein kinase